MNRDAIVAVSVLVVVAIAAIAFECVRSCIQAIVAAPIAQVLAGSASAILGAMLASQAQYRIRMAQQRRKVVLDAFRSVRRVEPVDSDDAKVAEGVRRLKEESLVFVGQDVPEAYDLCMLLAAIMPDVRNYAYSDLSGLDRKGLHPTERAECSRLPDALAFVARTASVGHKALAEEITRGDKTKPFRIPDDVFRAWTQPRSGDWQAKLVADTSRSKHEVGLRRVAIADVTMARIELMHLLFACGIGPIAREPWHDLESKISAAVEREKSVRGGWVGRRWERALGALTGEHRPEPISKQLETRMLDLAKQLDPGAPQPAPDPKGPGAQPQQEQSSVLGS